MLISISGTPATGKTTVSRLLTKMLNANLISISSLVKTKKMKSYYDKKRKTKVVNEKDITKAVEKMIHANKINIVEGHAAHIIKSDKVFVLRCSPPRLVQRMKMKGWGARKIRENVHAEILDTITVEALEANRKSRVFEIDTSNRTPRQTASLIVKLLNNHRWQKKYLAGRIDWTEKYKKYLLPHDYYMSA